LVLEVAVGDEPTFLNEAVSECGLSVVDVSDDAEVSYESSFYHVVMIAQKAVGSIDEPAFWMKKLAVE
jgi:hypothetical protein